MANSVDPDQTAPIGAVCSGSTLFASILNSPVMLGNYLQQTTSAEDIFRCIFFLGALRVKIQLWTYRHNSTPFHPLFLTIPGCMFYSFCRSRIHHECEGRVEKSVPRSAIWHHEACRVMTNGDPERWVFLSYPHTHDVHLCFFLFFFK